MTTAFNGLQQGKANASPWISHGKTVWHPHANGDRRIADCDTESAAKLVAAAPALLAIAEESLQTLIQNRECILEAATPEGDLDTADKLDRAIIQSMSGTILRIQTAIAAANGIST